MSRPITAHKRSLVFKRTAITRSRELAHEVLPLAIRVLLASIAHAGRSLARGKVGPPTDVNWQLVGSWGVAIDGDWALVSAFSECPTCEEGRFDAAALLYRYTGGSWQYQGILGTRQIVDPYNRPGLAMKDGIAVVTMQDTRIFELTAGVWTQVPHSVPAGGYQLVGPDIEINGGRILHPVVSGNSTFLVMHKVNGAWSAQGILTGQNDPHDPETNIAPDADIEGPRVVIYNPYDQEQDASPVIRRYYANANGSGWSQFPFRIESGTNYRYGPYVAMSGPNTAFTGLRNRGTEVALDHDNGVNIGLYGLQPADAFMQNDPLADSDDNRYSDTGVERVRGMFATRN